jgi:hypothetical protein
LGVSGKTPDGQQPTEDDTVKTTEAREITVAGIVTRSAAGVIELVTHPSSPLPAVGDYVALKTITLEFEPGGKDAR